MLKRKILDNLVHWKETKHHECLLVKGARQVGKTYIIKEFGKQYYKNLIYINFFENPTYMNIFEDSLQADEILKKISIYIPNFKIIPNETLIFLDEIQQCPNARTALKFLADNEDIDVIASGSLLGLSYNERTSIPVGYESQMTLYPLDFEEFLWAIGINEEAIAYFKGFFDKKEKLPNGINEEMLKKLREYIVVGGMPEVVNKFVDTKNFSEVQKVQDKIIAAYKDDIAQYAEVNEKPKIRRCYESIPQQLAKENTKFQYSFVERGSTSRKYADSIQWLVDANLITMCKNVSTPLLPLTAYEKDNQFKVYLNDIGLLIGMYGFDIKARILDNSITGYAKGGIYENLICDMLVKRGYSVHYYKTDNNSQEIEFLITQNSNIIPVEVKAGNGSSVSLNNFIQEYNPPYAFKLINGNIGIADTKITLPLYMTMFI